MRLILKLLALVKRNFLPRSNLYGSRIIFLTSIALIRDLIPLMLRQDIDQGSAQVRSALIELSSVTATTGTSEILQRKPSTEPYINIRR